jgi:hypothetical protein
MVFDSSNTPGSGGMYNSFGDVHSGDSPSANNADFTLGRGQQHSPGNIDPPTFDANGSPGTTGSQAQNQGTKDLLAGSLEIAGDISSGAFNELVHHKGDLLRDAAAGAFLGEVMTALGPEATLAAGAVATVLAARSVAQHLPTWVNDVQIVFNPDQHTSQEQADAKQNFQAVGAGGMELAAGAAGAGVGDMLTRQFGLNDVVLKEGGILDHTNPDLADGLREWSPFRAPSVPVEPWVVTKQEPLQITDGIRKVDPPPERPQLSAGDLPQGRIEPATKESRAGAAPMSRPTFDIPETGNIELGQLMRKLSPSDQISLVQQVIEARPHVPIGSWMRLIEPEDMAQFLRATDQMFPNNGLKDASYLIEQRILRPPTPNSPPIDFDAWERALKLVNAEKNSV